MAENRAIVDIPTPPAAKEASLEVQLLRAIAADPTNDATRLVYADWLTERGDPRGELISLELTLRDLDDFDERKKPTTARIRQLVEAHGKAWLAPFSKLGLRGVRLMLDRGLVASVAGSARALAAAAPSLLRGAPLVSDVTIEVGADRDLSRLTDSPLLPRIHQLALSHYTPVRPTGWNALVLPEVRAIRLLSIAAGPDDLAALFDAPNCKHLRELTISGCRLNKGAIEGLAGGAFELRSVDVPAHGLGPRLGELLGAQQRLEVVKIAGNPIGSAGLASLRPALRDVETLDLRGCELDEADHTELLSPGVLTRVRDLSLGGTPFSDRLIDRLVAWPGAANLVRLNLGGTQLSDRAARTLANAPTLAGLRSLVLSGSSFSTATKAALVDSPHLSRARIFAGHSLLGRKPATRPRGAPRRPPKQP
jgi:uncharacterized protein (TIGR02996 family)